MIDFHTPFGLKLFQVAVPERAPDIRNARCRDHARDGPFLEERKPILLHLASLADT